MPTIIQSKSAGVANTQTSVSITLDAPATAGNLLVAFHRFNTNSVNGVVPSGFTARATRTRSTFETCLISSKTAAGGETTLTASTTAVSGVNCLQELVVIEMPPGAFDVAATNDAAGVTTLNLGTTATLAAGNKVVFAMTGTTNAAGTWGAAPTGFTKLIDEATNNRLSISYLDTTVTTAQSPTQTWQTSGGAAGVVIDFTYTPPSTTVSWSFGGQLPLILGTPPSATLTKLQTPMFASQMGFDTPNSTSTANKTQSQWDQIATWYKLGHFEGHNWAKIIDSDNLSAIEKFTNGRSGWVGNVYVNGSYVTQGSPWFAVRSAAHIERNYPLGIATIDTTNGMTLSGSLNNSATTLTITLPTTKPSGLPTTHPGGTPSTFWPMIGSELTPSNTTFSRDTANYVSWVRIDDEMIGLPAYSSGTWSIAGGVATITGVFRGLWGTTAASHSSAAKVRTPVYIGSAAASPTDAGLTGNPNANSTTAPLRYGVNFWDYARGTLHDGLQHIADTASMELQAWNFGNLKTVSSVSGNTFTCNSHGYANGSRVAFGGYDIPGGLKSLTPYYIINQTTNTFQISTTNGGSAVTLTSTNAGNCVVANIRRDFSNPVTNGIWWDVTSVATYNNADPYGNDMLAQASLVDYPYDFTNGTTATAWSARQDAKHDALHGKLTSMGFAALNGYANNYLAQPNQVSGGERMTIMSNGEYDGYPLEHFAQETDTKFDGQFQQLCQVMRGVNGSNVVVNASGNKAAQWCKCYDWVGTAFGSAKVAQYIRFNYAMWLMAWRTTATTPKLMGKFYANSVTEPPSDTAGHEIFFWDFGVPTSQNGGKPTNPSTSSDLFQPVAGLYERKYTKGVILMNNTASSKNYTLPADMYDVLSEINGNDTLVLVSSGTVVSVPAYDARFYVTP